MATRSAATCHGYESLWLPDTLLTAGAQSSLTEALFAASRIKQVGLHFNKGLLRRAAGGDPRRAGHRDEPGGNGRLCAGHHRRW